VCLQSTPPSQDFHIAHFPHVLMLISGVVVLVVACDLRGEGEFSVPF
jgi:hypothetical protein